MRIILASLAYVACSAIAFGQKVPPDRGELERSEGAGMAAYADLNGYPGPKHVIELQQQLGLNDEQVKDIESVIDEMKEKARAQAEMIITTEEELEKAFRTGSATESSVKELAAHIGKLRGELRAVHLVAHIQAQQILTKDQVLKYNTIRHKSMKPAQGSK